MTRQPYDYFRNRSLQLPALELDTIANLTICFAEPVQARAGWVRGYWTASRISMPDLRSVLMVRAHSENHCYRGQERRFRTIPLGDNVKVTTSARRTRLASRRAAGHRAVNEIDVAHSADSSVSLCGIRTCMRATLMGIVASKKVQDLASRVCPSAQTAKRRV